MLFKQQYDREFFQSRRALACSSASVVLGILFEYVQPRSVLDLGCATGIWLAECKRRGVSEVLGVDGDWVDTDLLEVEKSEFEAGDLGTEYYTPRKKYDLAISVEVAEHLPPESGARLVSSLTKASDVVLFSAAVKGQGGTGHVNEQPQSYWAREFRSQGFMCFDVIRERIWEDESVNVVYKQNMVLYVRENAAARIEALRESVSSPYELDRVHPDLLVVKAKDAPGRFYRRGRRIAKRLLKAIPLTRRG
jgi:SAM-dependent methyltransferase